MRRVPLSCVLVGAFGTVIGLAVGLTIGTLTGVPSDMVYVYGSEQTVLAASEKAWAHARPFFMSLVSMTVGHPGRPSVTPERKLLLLRIRSSWDLLKKQPQNFALQAVQDQDPSVRAACLAELETMCHDTQAALRVIERCLGSENNDSLHARKIRLLEAFASGRAGGTEPLSLPQTRSSGQIAPAAMPSNATSTIRTGT